LREVSAALLFPLLTGRPIDRVSYAPVFLMVSFMPLIGTLLLFFVGSYIAGRRSYLHPKPQISLISALCVTPAMQAKVDFIENRRPLLIEADAGTQGYKYCS
jgi:hypothetical protein